MDENSLHGNLSEIPFAEVLHRIWQREGSGYLSLQSESGPRILSFDRGRAALDADSFPGRQFLRFLSERGILDPDGAAESENHAETNTLSPLKALLELGRLDPSALWRQMADYLRAEILPLFDLECAAFAFHAARPAPELRILLTLSVPGLVLEGIRRMKNQRIIEANLPPEEASLQVLSPCPVDPDLLGPHEQYVLKAVNHNMRLDDLYVASELGKKESQRVVFSLLVMGIVGPCQIRAPGKPLPGDAAAPDFDKIIAAFNDRYACIFKYVSKELGPVALSVLGKSLDEVRPRLGPLFQTAELRGDGRIDFRPVSKPGFNSLKGEQGKALTGSLNEILAAEVLTVKKTLGNSHESSLVRNLEKIGE